MDRPPPLTRQGRGRPFGVVPHFLYERVIEHTCADWPHAAMPVVAASNQFLMDDEPTQRLLAVQSVETRREAADRRLWIEAAFRRAARLLVQHGRLATHLYALPTRLIDGAGKHADFETRAFDAEVRQVLCAALPGTDWDDEATWQHAAKYQRAVGVRRVDPRLLPPAPGTWEWAWMKDQAWRREKEARGEPVGKDEHPAVLDDFYKSFTA